MNHCDFSVLKGETLKRITGAKQGSGVVTFETESGRKFEMYHEQDCCESVTLEAVRGDVEAASKQLVVDAVTERKTGTSNDAESETWTYYRLITPDHTLCFRWYGTSNGYYSESADFREIK